ncbi:MAG TPA: type I secretion protein TolC [Gammaproteobacteria bacterium]|nr:type I secretion protein TolC [Gammaproteobacteria bacterium]
MHRFNSLILGGLVASGMLLPVAHAENLLDVYQLATRADATLAAAEAKYQAALQARPQSHAPLRPQINASAGFDRKDISYKDANPAFSDDTYNHKTYGIRLDQLLFDRASWIRASQSDIQIAQAKAQILAERQDLIVRTAEAYFGVLAAEDNLRFAKAEKEAISRQLDETRERFQVGMIAITDVKESEAQHDLAVAQEIDAVNQLDIAKEELRVIIDQSPESLDRLKLGAVPAKADSKEDIDSWVKRAIDNSLTLKVAEMGVELAKQEVKRRRAGHLPTLGFKAELGVQDDEGGFSKGKATDTSLGLALKLPIYSGGLVSAQVAEADSLYRQAKEQYELQKREVVRQARASYLSVQSGRSRVKALQQALASTETAAEATQAGFEVGTRTAVDVLLSLRETYRAQRDFARARYDYVLSTFRLRQATGILAYGDLEKINKWM